MLAALLIQTLGVQTTLAQRSATEPEIEAYPAPSETPELRETDCLYKKSDIPDSMKDIAFTCGYVTVPQDHNNPDDENTIDLYVVIIPATGKSPSDTPLFVLGGGPGQGITDFLFAFDADYGADYANVASWSSMLEQHDIVLFDQRGTGKTLPEVVCPADRVPDGDEPTADDEAATESDANPYLDCADQLADEGIDLNTYNNHQSTADIDAVRLAIGAERIDLFGTSYGTWLALESMRYYPETIRSVILNSPLPPETMFYDSLMIGHQNALNEVFARCADDPDCDKANPDLAEGYAKAVETLNRNPMTLTYENPETGKTEKGPADGSVFSSLVYQLVFTGPFIPLIPPLITSVNNGESDVFEALVPLLISSSDGISTPLHFGLLCQDQIPYIDMDEVMAEVEDADVSQDVIDEAMPSIDNYTEICDAWDLTPSGEISNEPVHSDIPTLIFAGTFDPITPNFDGERLLGDLSNAVLVESPVAGHDPLSTSGQCGIDIAVAFLEHPRRELDTSCIDDLTLDFSPEPVSNDGN